MSAIGRCGAGRNPPELISALSSPNSRSMVRASGSGLSCRTAVYAPSFIVRTPSVDLGLGYRWARLQEVEVAPLVGLGDVLEVERPVSAPVLRRGLLPVRSPLLQLLVA